MRHTHNFVSLISSERVMLYLFSNVVPCNDTGTVRLSPIISDYNDTLGRLEVCYDGYWGTVCNDHNSIDRITADVACQQLGYERGQIC